MEKAGTEENQLAEMFPLFGHGIGLFWERPSLSIGLETDGIFRENMTFGIEAFLSKAGVGVAGYEDNILVTTNGAEVLTPIPPRHSCGGRIPIPPEDAPPAEPESIPKGGEFRSP